MHLIKALAVDGDLSVAETRAPASGNKLIGIELLRLVSAVGVLIWHYQHFGRIGSPQTPFVTADQPFFVPLSLFYTYGYYGVQVFWCISGFIFFWKYSTVISQRKLGGYEFFILRLSRLYPLHFITLIIVALLQLVYFSHNGSFFIYRNNDLRHFLAQLCFASSWGIVHGDSFNGPIWSISVEVLSYGFFFLSLRYISASASFLVLVIAAASFIQLKIYPHPIFECLIFFYIGCLTAFGYNRVRNSPRGRMLTTLGAAAAMVAVCVLPSLLAVQPIVYFLVFAPALTFLVVTHIPSTPVTSGILGAAGSMTYSSYLLHFPLQLCVATVATFEHLSLPIYSPVFFLAFIAITLVLAFYCYKYFEIPAQQYLRRRFLRRRFL